MGNGTDLAQAIKLFKISFQSVKTNCRGYKAQAGAPCLLSFCNSLETGELESSNAHT